MRRVLLPIVASCSSPAKPPAIEAPVAQVVPIDAAVDAAPDAAPELPADPVTRGAVLYESLGCIACHSIDGSWRIGPSWQGIWSTQVTLEGGVAIVVDANYLRESILVPAVKGRVGFARVMPPYDKLTNADLDSLIAFIKSRR